MKKVILGILTLAMVWSCSEKKQDQATVRENPQEEEQVTENVRCLPLYQITDSVQNGSHTYTYTIERVASDSLGVVEDDGCKYANTCITISIRKDGSKFFQHSFTKNSFSDVVDEDFLRKSILDGCRMMGVKDGMVVLSMCVSFPDSDLSQPLLLKIDGNGAYTIEKDNNMEE